MGTGGLDIAQHTGLPKWTTMNLELTSSTVETYRFYNGSTLVGTIVVEYIDTTKETLLSVSKS